MLPIFANYICSFSLNGRSLTISAASLNFFSIANFDHAKIPLIRRRDEEVLVQIGQWPVAPATSPSLQESTSSIRHCWSCFAVVVLTVFGECNWWPTAGSRSTVLDSSWLEECICWLVDTSALLQRPWSGNRGETGIIIVHEVWVVLNIVSVCVVLLWDDVCLCWQCHFH